MEYNRKDITVIILRVARFIEKKYSSRGNVRKVKLSNKNLAADEPVIGEDGELVCQRVCF